MYQKKQAGQRYGYDQRKKKSDFGFKGKTGHKNLDTIVKSNTFCV